MAVGQVLDTMAKDYADLARLDRLLGGDVGQF